MLASQSKRCTAHVSPRAPKKGPRRLYAFGFADLAVLLDSTSDGVRMAIERGRFDPCDLNSILQYAEQRGRLRLLDQDLTTGDWVDKLLIDIEKSLRPNKYRGSRRKNSPEDPNDRTP